MSSEDKQNDDWEFKLRLFLSADISGSTAYKSRSTVYKSHSTEWASTFRNFFTDFPQTIAEGYAQAFSKEDIASEDFTSPVNKMVPWKFSGDEILFRVDILNSLDVATHLQVFKKAIHSFPDKWEEELSLGLKGTAWLAGFPVTNTTIRLTGDKDHPETIDFIGPAIDLGFRITKYSTERHFVLSVDLALMLLRAKRRLEIDDSIHLHFHGWEYLKGVNQGRKYPIIWLDVFDGEETPELLSQNLYREKAQIDSDRLLKFLEKYIDSEPNLLTQTFIEGEKGTKYSNKPSDIDKKRDEMRAAEDERGYGNEDETEEPPKDTEKDVTQTKIKTRKP